MKKAIKALCFRYRNALFPLMGGVIGLVIGICYSKILTLGPLLALIFVINFLVGLLI